MNKYNSIALVLLALLSSSAAGGAEIGSSLVDRINALRKARGATETVKLPPRPPVIAPAPAPEAVPIPVGEAETDFADPDGVLAGLESRRPADAIDWRPVTALPESTSGHDVPGEAMKTPGLLVSPGGETFLLEPRERRISLVDPATGRLTVFARDASPGLIETADAAVLSDGSLILADNSRQAVYLFKSFRHAATIGLIGERRLFRFIRHVFALPDGRFGVTDTGANRSFLFSSAGDLQLELSGIVEPVWVAGKLVRLVTDERRVKAIAIDPATGRESPIFTYDPPAGHVPLDARAIGTAASGNELDILVSEGAGDADHLAWSRVLRYRSGTLQTASVLPDLSFDLSGRRSCVLADRGGTARLVSLRQTAAGTGLFTAELR